MRGFSLLELLVVMVVVGIMAAIAIPNAAAVSRAVEDKALLRQRASIRDAANAYFKDHEFSYDGMSLSSLGPYGYLHFDSAVVVNLIPGGALRFTAVVAEADLRHTLTVDSTDGEVTLR
jgi:prepilin-type N-terminal cleavage/methylation domain-containing protein